jgi:small subunit ribosomal protein S1
MNSLDNSQQEQTPSTSQAESAVATAPGSQADATAHAAATPVAHEAQGGDDADGDDAPGEEGSDEGAAGEAASVSADGTKKKRRRRRKKKPSDGTEAAAAGSEGAAPNQGERSRSKRPERERPPFNIGDIVFGKVLEVTSDVLFVDLSGKAKAIFDLRELLIPEEEARAVAALPADSGDDAEETHATDQAVAKASAEAIADTAPAVSDSTEAPSAPAEGESPSAPEVSAEAAPAPQLPRVILEAGAQFVGVVQNDGARGGCAVVTHHPERVRRTKPLVAKAAKDGSLVYGIVTGTIKGGVEVDVDGLRAFAPASHMSLRHGDLSAFVGKRLGFAVTQYAKRGRDVVVSRKAILEAEAAEQREAVLKTLQVGAEVEGVVRTVTTFGAFLDIGGIEGLVQLSEMSHNRSDRPSDVFKPGETMQVKVLRIDDKGKIALSRKACVPDPWASIRDKYTVGSAHKAKVMRLHQAGAFVELEAGIDALLRRSDVILGKTEEFDTLYAVGSEHDFVIASMDRGTQRIAVHRALSGDQAAEAAQRVQLNKHVKCVVTSVEASGLVVRILGVTGPLARGFVPASATATVRGADLKKLFPVGKELDAKVTELDRRGEPRLSIRALNEEQERSAYQQYRQQVKRDARFTLGDLLAKRDDKNG